MIMAGQLWCKPLITARHPGSAKAHNLRWLYHQRTRDNLVIFILLPGQKNFIFYQIKFSSSVPDSFIQRWLWDWIFISPEKSRRQNLKKSRIPAIGIFSSKIPKSRKFITKMEEKGRINHCCIFVRENQKSQKIPKIYYKNGKKAEFIIVVFLWGKTKNPKKSFYQENPRKSHLWSHIRWFPTCAKLTDFRIWEEIGARLIDLTKIILEYLR